MEYNGIEPKYTLEITSKLLLMAPCEKTSIPQQEAKKTKKILIIFD